MSFRKSAVLGFFLLVALHLVLAASMRAPIILGDEVANLGIARFFAGRAPDPLLAYPVGPWAPYYRFGYALLVAPAWKLSGDPLTVYRLALALNGFLAASLFPLFAAYARRTLALADRDALVAGFGASLYTSYLLQPNVTWSESLLLPVVLGVVLAFQRLAARPGLGAACAFALLTAFAYAVHERTLGLVPLALLALALLWRRGKLSGRAALAAAAVALAAFAAVRAVDAEIFARLWRDAPPRFRVADLASRLADPASLGNALLSLCGQLWTLTVASALLFPLGAWVLGRTAWRAEEPERRLSAQFTLAAAAILLATSSIWLNHFTRADLAIYGRYSEVFLGPFLVAGLAGFHGAFRRRPAVLALALLPGLLVTIVLAGHDGAVFQRIYNEMNLSGIMPAIVLVGGLRLLQITALGTAAGIAVLLAGLVRPRAAAVLAGALFLAGALLVHQRWLVPIQEYAFHARSLPDAVRDLGVREVAYDLAGSTHDEFFAYQFRLGDARYVLFDDRRSRPPRDLVISNKAFGQHHPGARLVYPERTTNQALWAMPGPFQERLRSDGRLFPADPGAPLPREALCSRLAWSPPRGPAPLELGPGKERRLDLRLTHCGKGSPWLPFGTREDPTGAVRVGVRWFRDGAVAADHRVELPHVLAPGASIEIEVPIAARTPEEAPLPPGTYEVRIALVQELVQWFEDAGEEEGLKLVVEVE